MWIRNFTKCKEIWDVAYLIFLVNAVAQIRFLIIQQLLFNIIRIEAQKILHRIHFFTFHFYFLINFVHKPLSVKSTAQIFAPIYYMHRIFNYFFKKSFNFASFAKKLKWEKKNKNGLSFFQFSNSPYFHCNSIKSSTSFSFILLSGFFHNFSHFNAIF